MLRVLVVLILSLCYWRVLSLDARLDVTCSGPLCHVTLDYPDHFVINNNVMLVGLRDEIIQLTLDFKLLQRMSTSSDRLSLSCRHKQGNETTGCHNYHRSIVFPTGNQVIVGTVRANKTFITCGTNYYTPTCEYRLISDLSLVRKHTSIGFCPEVAEVPLAFVESGTTMWVGTVLESVQHGLLSQSLPTFNGGISLSTIIDSGFWLQRASFVDLYEEGEYIYAFFKETPVEMYPDLGIRSRVARICKEDAGHYIIHQRTYQSFVKSSIRCGVSGMELDDKRYQDISFYFDNLYDTTLLRSGSYRQSSRDRPMQLYGVFQNSGNGPTGSVVCVYTLDYTKNDIARVFSGPYLRRFAELSTWMKVDNRSPFTCKSGRSIKQSTNEIVMYNEVEQANPASSPLYLKEGQKFHKIAVGQVTALDGVVYEVMFIVVENEAGNYSINKVSFVEARAGQRSVEHDVLKLSQSDYRINHMYYHQQDDEMDMIYISTPNRLYRMNPYHCSAHQSCGSCVASMDPYCVYDIAQGACVGINSANLNTSLQNVTHGVADCPETDASHDNDSTAGTIPISPTADDLKTNENDDDSREKAWQWAGIGASVGMCMGFVTGISFMFAWQRWIKLFRGHITKDAALSRGAHGSGDPRNKKKKSSANYTSITNESLINSEHRAALNSTAVNESFELTGINRTSSFHSLSCYTNDV